MSIRRWVVSLNRVPALLWFGAAPAFALGWFGMSYAGHLVERSAVVARDSVTRSLERDRLLREERQQKWLEERKLRRLQIEWYEKQLAK